MPEPIVARHFSIQFTGKPKLHFLPPIPSTWTLRQNVHGNNHTSPPISYFGEVKLAADPVIAAPDGQHNTPLKAVVVGFQIVAGCESRQFEREVMAWIVQEGDWLFIRFVDVETFQATGSQLAYPPPMPPPTTPAPKPLATTAMPWFLPGAFKFTWRPATPFPFTSNGDGAALVSLAPNGAFRIGPSMN